MPFEKLPEHEREQNRGAVHDIPNKLVASGYAMVPRRNNEPDYVFPDDVLDAMAQLEHDRWVKAKKERGWKYAEETDKENKHHALLVEWEKLPEEERDKDKPIISTMSAMLGLAGYTIVKLAEE